eukprot:Nk52_evm11s745 gene=Nk52_evmTU11s745
MTMFRACIDLHEGCVKQIVGGTLSDSTDGVDGAHLKTNFVSTKRSSFYASLYKENALKGGHVIMLGAGNRDAAIEALQAYPKGLQIGGGINNSNAKEWLNLGASKVIVTSWIFPEGVFSMDRLKELTGVVGKENLVLDLSCRSGGNGKWFVAINKWQTVTSFEVNRENLEVLSGYCSEFLVHAADVEGLCKGIDAGLVRCLGEWCTIPCTYAGGGRSLADLSTVQELSNGKVDLTFGSALDIFGGTLVSFEECVSWNKRGT